MKKCNYNTNYVQYNNNKFKNLTFQSVFSFDANDLDFVTLNKLDKIPESWNWDWDFVTLNNNLDKEVNNLWLEMWKKPYFWKKEENERFYNGFNEFYIKYKISVYAVIDYFIYSDYYKLIVNDIINYYYSEDDNKDEQKKNEFIFEL